MIKASKDNESRVYPFFIDYYTEKVGPLAITDEDYARGNAFYGSLLALKTCFKGLGNFRMQFFEDAPNGVLVVEPKSPISRTVAAKDPSCRWMVSTETEQTTDLVVVSYLILQPDLLKEPGSMVAHGVSPVYNQNNGRGDAALQENYTFNPLAHTYALLKGRHEPDTLPSPEL